MVVDPSLVSGGLPAGYAISLPLYLSNVTLPAILSALPGAETQQFVLNMSPASLVVNSGQSVRHCHRNGPEHDHLPTQWRESTHPNCTAVSATDHETVVCCDYQRIAYH
jgi:hypothetical protein